MVESPADRRRRPDEVHDDTTPTSSWPGTTGSSDGSSPRSPRMQLQV